MRARAGSAFTPGSQSDWFGPRWRVWREAIPEQLCCSTAALHRGVVSGHLWERGELSPAAPSLTLPTSGLPRRRANSSLLLEASKSPLPPGRKAGAGSVKGFSASPARTLRAPQTHHTSYRYSKRKFISLTAQPGWQEPQPRAAGTGCSRAPSPLQKGQNHLFHFCLSESLPARAHMLPAQNPAGTDYARALRRTSPASSP